MKRTINIIAAAALCVGLGSCAEKDLGSIPGGQTYEADFAGTTRFGGDGTPEHADTYRIMAFSKTGAINKEVYSGVYAYDNTEYIDNPLVGSIVPVAMSYESRYSLTDVFYDNCYYYKGDYSLNAPVVRDGGSGLHLEAGSYYVSMIHPAVQVQAMTGTSMGSLPAFERADKIYASNPRNKDADATADDPFEITVTSNGQIHDAAGVVMTPVMSAIEVYFYSYFYPEGAADPKSANYTVEEIYLVNAGRNGLYSPMEDIVYPNYNYKSGIGYRSTYSSTVLMDNGRTTQNQLPLTANDVKAQNIEFTDRKTNQQAKAMYKTDTIPVFPSDYRGADMGGNPLILPMTIQVKLKTSTGLFNKASIPISFIVERNKIYKFYVNVTSELITVFYSVSPWETNGDAEYSDIGDLPTIYLDDTEFDRDPGDWEDGGGGEQEIKDANP